MKKFYAFAVVLSLLSFSAFAADDFNTMGPDEHLPQTAVVGKAKIGGLAQGWLVNDTTHSTPFQLLLGRAHLKVSSDIGEKTRAFFYYDVKNSAVLDAGAQYALGIWNLHISAGQFRTPTTAEGLLPSYRLLFADRSMIARALGYRRETGAMLGWTSDWVRINGMISNGTTLAGGLDTTNKKDFHLRAETVLFDLVQLGGFATAGDYSLGTKHAYGLNAGIDLEGLVLKGEFGTAKGVTIVDGNGLAVDAAFTFGNLQPVARYEYLEVASGVPSAKAATVGVNFLMHNHESKVQAQYSMLTDASSAGTGSITPAPGIDGSLWNLVFSAAF